jgi:anthranilate synthase component 2
VLLIDNVDSFTYNLLHALVTAGVRCDVVRHDAATADALVDRDWDGLVIGPGPCSPHEAGVTLPLLERLDENMDGRAVLGICLGHQAIAVASGGRVERARRAVHGAEVTLRHDGEGCLAGLGRAPRVVRYNSLSVSADLPSALEACAWDEHGDLMALRHRELPREGIQFHPESWLSRDGLPVLRTWVGRLRLRSSGRSGRLPP